MPPHQIICACCKKTIHCRDAFQMPEVTYIKVCKECRNALQAIVEKRQMEEQISIIKERVKNQKVCSTPLLVCPRCGTLYYSSTAALGDPCSRCLSDPKIDVLSLSGKINLVQLNDPKKEYRLNIANLW